MTQVGYLENLNTWENGEESLSENIEVLETSASTSIVYGNNSQWAPSGSLETYGFSGSADIIATSDDVILLKGKNGKDSRTYCIIAYNYVNKTSWQPNIVGTSQCPGQNSAWKFIGIIDGVTLVRYDSGSSTSGSQAIFGYNPSNDTFYSIASLPSTGASVGSAAMIGRNVYMGTSHSDVTIFNYDNQTIWDLTNLNCGYSFHSSYFGAVGDKIFSKCGNWLGIFDPVTQSLSIPSDLTSVYVNSTIDTARSVVLGDQLLFLGDDGVHGKELWVYDASNDSGWMAADIAVGSDSAWLSYGYLNPMRSGTKVLFEATDHFGDNDLWWYDSINASVWRATNFSDPNIDFHGHSHNSYGELANGVIAIGHRNLDNQPSSYYSYYISFYNPNNGTVWQESGLYQSMESNSYALNNNGQIKLRAVYGNNIIGTAHANTGNPVGHYVKVFAYDITNQTLQFSANLGEAQYSHNDIVHTNMVTFGDHILYGLACGNNIANSCPTIGGGRQAAAAWSPGAIAVNDAWNISAGDRLDGPISGGDGRFYSSGVGMQNMTASGDGANILIGDSMTDITFEYDAAVANPQLLAKNLGIGDKLSCGLLENGSVACWGDDLFGQLGLESSGTLSSSSPILTASMPGNQKAVALDTSRLIGCVVLTNGSVACWGWTWGYGEMGDGSTTTGARTPVLTESFGVNRYAVDVSTTDQGACVLLDNSSVSCWGYGSKGTIGDGQNSDRSSPTPTASMPGNQKVVSLTSGYTHHCALLEDGTVACWGRNNQGQLGDNSTTNRNTPTLTNPLGASAIAIESDHGHTCALLITGSVVCWGDNSDGQIGNGTSGGNVLVPTPVSSITGTAVSISTSSSATCALLDNNSVTCWGANSVGQIGNGTTSSGTIPDYTSSFATNQIKLMLDGGRDVSCSLVDNGSIYCWGRNNDGQIGDGTTAHATTPTWVDTSYKFLTTRMKDVISASSCSVSPALPTGLGIDSSTCTISGTPTSAVDNRTYTVIATIDGISFQTSVWLSTAYKQLTSSIDGSELHVGAAMEEITFESESFASSDSLSLGMQRTCAIIDNGSMKCWGNYANGGLGNGLGSGSDYVGDSANEMGDNLPVTNLGTGRTATLLASSIDLTHSCAILDNGSVKCWGDNFYGQLGIGNTNTIGDDINEMGDNLTAVDLGSGRTAIDLGLGMYSSCAVLDNGSVKCWGANTYGQLGIGNTNTIGDDINEMGDNLTAVDLGTGRTATQIASGRAHVCVILDNGAVKCWGTNGHGNLGIGNTTTIGNIPNEMGDNLLAVDLGTGRTAIQIESANAHTCAILDNGDLKCLSLIHI